MERIVESLLLCVAVVLLVGATGCSGRQADEEEVDGMRSRSTTVETPLAQTQIAQRGYTDEVPQVYFATAEHQGTVERIEYLSRDYAGGGGEVVKPAYVYLPYGYRDDSEARYDIFYIMHGWGGTADEFFSLGGGMAKNMLDHMVAQGDIVPTIVVAATFDTDNEPQDFGRSVAELRQFHRDFTDDLMPAVEGRYHTYADSTSSQDLEASRDHRAFGGFSLGSVTTWMQFCHNYDYIRYFLPMSGACWYYGGYGDFQSSRNADFLEQLVADENLDERGFFIYSATGTLDAVRDQVDMLMDEMLPREAFGPEHLVYYQKRGGVHNFDACLEYVYNALPHFFGNRAS